MARPRHRISLNRLADIFRKAGKRLHRGAWRARAPSRAGGHSFGHSDVLKAGDVRLLLVPGLGRLAKFLEEMMLAVRQGFEPWVQVLARTTV